MLRLQGQAIAEIDGVEHHVAAGEMSFIPAGIPHRFINTSATSAMKILWT